MVMKLKAPPPKEPLFRQVTCQTCQWIVAAGTWEALLNAGWSGCKGKVKETDKHLVWAFVCKTCARKYPNSLGKMPNIARIFRSLPAAPENPFPCIGVEGHETSRPEDGQAAPVVLN